MVPICAPLSGQFALRSVMRFAVVPVTLLLVGCGSTPTAPTHAPAAPTPAPAQTPTRIAVTGTITSTVSGQAVGAFAQDVDRLPAQVTVSLSGFVTRQTWVRSASPTVDLFPETGFDLGFYRQFARNGLESPGSLSALRVLSQAPAIYLQTAGLSAATVATLEAITRDVVPAFTGGRLSVTQWVTGNETRPEQNGWVVIELIQEENGKACGRALVGTASGHIWLNTAPRCHWDGHNVDPGTLAHELGHTLGFRHVTINGALMRSDANRTFRAMTPTMVERDHAALAYARQAGNTDVDVDPLTPSQFSTRVVID